MQSRAVTGVDVRLHRMRSRAITCRHMRSHSLQVPMLGCTSCRGLVLNGTWLTHKKEFALGLWGIADDAGAYSVIHIEARRTICPMRPK